MGRSIRQETLLPLLWGQLSSTFSNATEVAEWETPSCSRLQQASDNGTSDGRSNLQAVLPERLLHSVSASPQMCLKPSGIEHATLEYKAAACIKGKNRTNRIRNKLIKCLRL